MTTRPLIKDSLALLNVCGMNPLNNSNCSKFRAILAQILLMGFSVEILFKFVSNWKGIKSMDGLGVFLGISQDCVKLSLIVLNRKRLYKLLKKIEKFSPFNEQTEQIQTNNKKFYAIIQKYMNMTVIIAIATHIVYFSKPILSGSKTLPLDTYHPKNLNNLLSYRLAYTLQFLIVSGAIPCFVGFDSLFVSLIINIVQELKILKNNLARINVNSSNKSSGHRHDLFELHRLVDRHNLVMECINIVNEIYYIFLLILFFEDMIVICTGLLCIAADGFPPTYAILTKYGLFVVLFVSQLFFYCFCGSYLITECESLSSGIYNSDWYLSNQPNLRKSCILVIQRANKTEKLTAGGMITVNLESFANIIKSALSFFALMHAVYNEDFTK